MLRNAWYAVTRSAVLQEAPLTVRALGEQFVLWRSPQGTVQAMADQCPHRGAQLSRGWLTAGCLTALVW
ncbi:Rieske (2Fe-2S) protein [Synechococcus sp. PCC 6716]|nr:Rieske (2Fe-2S) protein [Synechococcus sp. PCC 6716]